MNKQLSKLLLGAVLCTSLLASLIVSVEAQGPIPTPTPPPQVVVLSSDPDLVTFSQLGQEDIMLLGPYDGTGFSFSIPANWDLKGGIQLNLSLGVSFQSTPHGVNESFAVGGGTLTLYLNDVFFGVIQLSEVGETEQSIEIPGEVLARFLGKPMELSFFLDGRYACYADNQLIVSIHKNSYFIFPHDLVKPDTNLINFPRPIIQSSLNPDSALFVLPSQPSPVEMQAALTLAAGMGNLSGNRIKLDLTTLDKFKPEQDSSIQASTNHIIFVGKPTSLPIMRLLHLPLPVTDNGFSFVEGETNDGLIQMINSPWSDAHVVLVVSGNTDEAVVKAAQAVSTGLLRPGSFPNLAVVKEVQAASKLTVQATDFALSELDPTYTGSFFQSRGFNARSFAFNIPPGLTVTPDAYLKLVFGNSALINYNRSGITVRLNGRTIHSVRLSDLTASQPINSVEISIPSSVAVSGYNVLEIAANIEYIDDNICDPPEIQGAWVNIWPETTLHLPLDLASVNPVTNQDLASYPAPFIYDSLLSQTAFVLPSNNLTSWQMALQIASYLGSEANGTITALKVFLDNEISEVERSEYNILVIGVPDQLPIVDELNDYLPAPFSDDNNIASEGAFQVTYRIPPDSPLGYIQTISSPWEPDNVVLTVLGNTDQGLRWAASALIDPLFRSRLAGNFAVINDQQVLTSDTRTVSVATGSEYAETAGDENILSEPEIVPALEPALDPRQSWILPVLQSSVAAIVLIVIIVAIRGLLRNSTRVQKQKTKQQSSKDE
ncbi:MAG: hypothetical protein HN736_05895 [Anaerolineae bacterium]|jgi:hypothetical protein|nr:hypothetical protein [Anaerolineae bacterium]MBT6060315.1 hypothetical protein [Anaerolineae bacterium]MBT6322774.1 hypothetical protein [Anaerolineae bacterium]MBT6813889.1 hypothetical protein [Anaerolineae bacterium]MBT7774229.1 hypothetical protein [Anaerolineae bacterium]